MCVFDFVVEVSGIPPGIIQIRIDRIVTDREEGNGTVFEGELDLSQGSGQEVIDDEPVDMWCTEP
jgi:hypothetical protein